MYVCISASIVQHQLLVDLKLTNFPELVKPIQDIHFGLHVSCNQRFAIRGVQLAQRVSHDIYNFIKYIYFESASTTRLVDPAMSGQTHQSVFYNTNTFLNFKTVLMKFGTRACLGRIRPTYNNTQPSCNLQAGLCLFQVIATQCMLTRQESHHVLDLLFHSSKLQMATKALFIKAILAPTLNYDIQVWGTAS